MEMQISNAAEFPLYHSMAAGPHSFQLPGAIPPVSTIPSYKNTMFPDRLGFYYDSAGVTHTMPTERCDRCYVELSAIGAGHHFGKKLCGMCAAKEQQVSPKVDTEILDLDSQQVMSQQQQQQQQQDSKAFLQQQQDSKAFLQQQQQDSKAFLQQQQQQDSKAFLQHGGGVVVPPGYDRPPPPPPPPAVEWPGYFQPQQNTLSGEHLSPDYNNVTTTTTTPPTMMGGSPPSDMQQQQQYQANFDGGGGGGGGGGGYAVNSNHQSGGGSSSKGNGSWKSNEARRAKTYECPACDKWFTSSGHLKRHYGTQLHKNAVKQSGKPDPALLPMKHHYHPYRDPAYVAQQKLKQQQQNGGGGGGVGSSLHKQQSSMMMSADFRPVTSTSSFNTDSFLELTPPNLTASLSDSLGGTQFLPARRPVSSSSSNSSSNSSTAGFTDEIQVSSYPCSNSSSSRNSYPADPATAVDRTARPRPVTSYHGHRPSTVDQQARSAYRHHQITDTIQPYTTTTQVSMIQPITNTDSYITMPDNRYDHHLNQYHHDIIIGGGGGDHHQHQHNIDYQPSSSTSSAPSYLQQQQQQQQHHQQQQQQTPPFQRLSTLIKQDPCDLGDFTADDASVASPDSSFDQSVVNHHQYRGLLVVAPLSSPPPPSHHLHHHHHHEQHHQHHHQLQTAVDDDAAACSDSGGSDFGCGGGGSAELSCSPSPPQQHHHHHHHHQAAAKKFRKATRVTCQLCNKDFTDKCYKTQHDQRFHSGEKPYRCGVCGKRFGEHKQLQVHELRHNDSNKAFPCTMCAKSFNFKNDLDRHFMSSHSAEKPYQCVQCKKKFVRLDHKRHHEKTHGGAVEKTKKKKKADPVAPCYEDQ